MTISCATFAEMTGAYCYQIDRHTLLVSTPLCFPDNTPVNLYIENRGDAFVITDDGDTLMRLHGLGMGKNPRLHSSIHKRAAAHNGALVNGCVTFTSAVLREAYLAYLKTMLDIISYELEHSAISEETALAINDVVIQLQRRNPDCTIERDVTIIGSTGAAHRFPIKAGDRLVDVTRPHHQSTGSILRKVADIEKIGIAAPLIIVDDTNNFDLAVREASLIGAFVPAMTLTTLKAESAPLSLKSH